MAYTEELLFQLHNVELKILNEIMRVCKENNINCFAYAGTLLGTIRHDGFIPWDDDIDLAMLREDYEKFIKIAPQKLNKGFHLEHFYTNKYTPTYYCKVCLDNTVFTEEYLKDIPIHHGVFVDIFPFDNYPSDIKTQSKYKRKLHFYDQLNRAKVLWKISDLTQGKKRFFGSITRVILHILMIPFKREFLFRKMDNAVKQFNNDNCLLISSRGKAICNKADLMPLISHKFENTEILVPHKYDIILKSLYGNYMELPPVEKRIGHAPSSIKI